MERVPFRPGKVISGLIGLLLFCVPAWSRAQEPQPADPVIATVPPVVPNSECMDCHEAEFKSRKRGLPKEWIGVRPEVFAKSVHGELNCVDCHATITEPEHPSKLPPAQCASCHAEAVEQFSHSIHGVSHEMGSSEAASCASCHGTHDMVPVKQSDSPVFVFNLAKTCATCHDDPKINKDYRMGQEKAAGHYLDSIHGRALTKMGLVVAPTCNDCHGVHDIKRSIDKDSLTNHANIATSCGACHLGIEDTYNESVHGQLLLKGDKQGPVCTDCHSAHDIEKPTPISRPRATRVAASVMRTGSPITAKPTTARPWPWASRTSPPTSRPATIATVTTTCSP